MIERQFLAHVVRRLRHGRIRIILPSGTVFEQVGDSPGLRAELALHRWRAVRRLIVGGHVAFADAYIDGDWSSPDLTALIELVAHNHQQLMPRLLGPRLMRGLYHLGHLLKPNSRRGSRRNIMAHYDLGNDFYAAWLDADMTYSSGLFDGEDMSLEAAQRAKQDLVIDKLALNGGEQLLEIGCGWGSLARRLAAERACNVLGITLSAAQLAHATSRAAAISGPGQAELRLQDYRDVQGVFDRIVSIEMLEAVGKRYWAQYFDQLYARLRPAGLVVLQVITMADTHYARYARGADFIQRHIFPGGMLPTDSIIRKHVAAVGFELENVEQFGASYARTLQAWRQRFLAAWPQLRAMGFDTAFKHKWEYYLSYCEAGFRAGHLDVGLYTLRKT